MYVSPTSRPISALFCPYLRAFFISAENTAEKRRYFIKKSRVLPCRDIPSRLPLHFSGSVTMSLASALSVLIIDGVPKHLGRTLQSFDPSVINPRNLAADSSADTDAFGAAVGRDTDRAILRQCSSPRILSRSF